MGTFHDDKGELHGMTVVVRTHGPRVYVGRCDTRTDEGIVLMDVDQHDDGQDGKTTADYLDFAVKYGVFKKHDMLRVPAGEIADVSRLGELR